MKKTTYKAPSTKIADFMGVEFAVGKEMGYWTRFSEDWNLLMPVVEKIEKMDKVVLIGTNTCTITNYFMNEDLRISVKSDSKISAVYKAVEMFIDTL